MRYLADIKLYDGNNFYGWGPLGLEGRNPQESPSIFAAVISTTIGVLTLVAILWFVFVFITGAIGIISSGGDKGSLEAAKKKITNGLIGLVVTIFSVIIIRLIGSFVGLGDLLLFGDLFTKLQIL